MSTIGNDRWEAEFRVSSLCLYFYTVHAWVDHFTTWRYDLKKRANQELSVELLIGAELVEQAAQRASAEDAARLQQWAESLRAGISGVAESEDLAATARYPTCSLRRQRSTANCGLVTARRLAPPRGVLSPLLTVRAARYVTRLRKRCTTNCGRKDSTSSIFRRSSDRSPLRKGKNHRRRRPGRRQSGAIGDETGGHTAIHPELGTLQQFQSLLAAARDRGLELALDIAFQCSPITLDSQSRMVRKARRTIQ